jgi:hypothetical protein
MAFLLIFSLTATAQLGFGKKGNKGESAPTQGSSDQATLIQNKLISQINLTKTTADRSDIVTAGDIVVLQKDGVMMCSTASAYAYSNTYENGVLTANQKNRAKDAAMTGTKTAIMGHFGLGNGASTTDAANNACASRKFVAGEKFWITGIVAKKDGILVSTFSDPYDDVRFYGEIKFSFPKGSVPTVDDFVKTVSEVITVQPAEGQGDQGNQGDQGGQQAPAASADQAPPPDIAPPPPPADAPPPTIALHQTKDEVIAIMGQPTRIAKLGVKEIFYYKDMKVTFTNGKVSNIE